MEVLGPAAGSESWIRSLKGASFHAIWRSFASGLSSGAFAVQGAFLLTAARSPSNVPTCRTYGKQPELLAWSWSDCCSDGAFCAGLKPRCLGSRFGGKLHILGSKLAKGVPPCSREASYTSSSLREPSSTWSPSKSQAQSARKVLHHLAGPRSNLSQSAEDLARWRFAGVQLAPVQEQGSSQSSWLLICLGGCGCNLVVKSRFRWQSCADVWALGCELPPYRRWLLQNPVLRLWRGPGGTNTPSPQSWCSCPWCLFIVQRCLRRWGGSVRAKGAPPPAGFPAKIGMKTPIPRLIESRSL